MIDSVQGLPMPADLDVTVGRQPRLRVRQSPEARFPFPIPNGWFIVARASDIDPGGLVPVHYFGRDLVVFRTADGTARTVDAYCAHLGAHFAAGGRVEGSCVRCPFHGWAYDGASGSCVEIPYAASGRIPAKAKVRAYPTLERNQMIWAWHHLEGKDPFYDVPVVPEFDDAAWSAPDCRDFWVRTCCQEMAENNHDFAHFQFVHGSPDIPWDTHLIDGYYKRADAFGGSFVRETFGLGLGVLRTPGSFTFLSSTTPIDDENVHVRWVFTTPVGSPAATEEIADRFLSGVSQDIPIWENKVYRPRPVLTKEESGIAQHREWSKQFYSDPANALD
jgi:nitrite reductase/ring-hydroxylating ferredoxin subunit